MAGEKMIGRPASATLNTGNLVVPDQVVNEVVQLATQSSAVMARAKRVQMSSKKYNQPVLAELPDAYWVNGEPGAEEYDEEKNTGSGTFPDPKPDAGLKKTTKIGWKPMYMTAEEIAVIVPIPDAMVDDSNIPLWAACRPLIAEAIGRKIDSATMWGSAAGDTIPASWDKTLTTASVMQTVDAGDHSDYSGAIAEAGEKLAMQNLSMNGFVSSPGLQWRLAQARDAVGQPIYVPSLTSEAPGSLYGLPLSEVKNGAWNPAKDTALIAADWSKVFLGIRQDMTFDMFREGVLTDSAGKVILNLMQQDAKALRVVMRVGFTVAQPYIKRLNSAGTAYETVAVKPVVQITGKPKPKPVLTEAGKAPSGGAPAK